MRATSNHWTPRVVVPSRVENENQPLSCPGAHVCGPRRFGGVRPATGLAPARCAAGGRGSPRRAVAHDRGADDRRRPRRARLGAGHADRRLRAERSRPRESRRPRRPRCACSSRATTLYIGVICFDCDPSKIVTTDSRRDSALTGQDSFQMILDTYHDRQNGFIFGTNAVGIQYDAQVRNEGETLRGGPPGGLGGGNTTGAGGGVNVNWDGSWDVKTHVTESGWTAEFAIPLAHASLRSAAAGLGREFLAHHRAEARARLLVAGVAHLHHHAAVVGRRAARSRRAGAARLQADAVRDLVGEPELRERRPRRDVRQERATGASTARSA